MALSAELTAHAAEPLAVASYYTRPTTNEAGTVSLKEFWQGAKRLPQSIEVATQSGVTAIVVKKRRFSTIFGKRWLVYWGNGGAISAG
jgi:hypothetical protein